MRAIKRICFNKMYNGYAVHIPTEEYATRKVAYVCAKCNTSFTVSHRWYGYQNGEYRDRYLFCPKCGNTFNNYGNAQGFKETEYSDKEMPCSMALTLYEMKYGYKLYVSSGCINISQTGEASGCRNVEEIRFDVKEKKVTWKGRPGKKPMELGNPYDLTFLKRSLLGDLALNVTRDKENSRMLTELMKALRDGVRRKFKKLHGYDIGSLFTRRGTSYGYLSMPIMGIAYRLLMPDIKKGLPEFIYKAGYAYADAIQRLGLSIDNTDCLKIFAHAETMRKARDSVTGIMEVYGIRDIPSYRRLIMEHPLHAVYVGVLDKYFGNDTACRLFNHIMGKFESGSYVVSDAVNKLSRILEKLTGIWNADEVAKFIMRSFGRAEFWDMDHMIHRLNENNVKKLSKVRLKDAHDWMKDALYKQENDDYSLMIPDAVRRRLEMQKDRLKFFMPDTNFKLRDVGKAMHNCVGSYAKKVLDKSCGIVVMTDDKGMMLACLEVRNGDGRTRLMQAKLKNNRPVRLNTEVNDAVAEWCRSAGVDMITADIETPEERGKRLEERKTMPICADEAAAV